jgi:hypothetical protein
VDIKPFINGGISDALKDEEYFKNVKINEFFGITWENGFDFCPNFLRQYIKLSGEFKNFDGSISNVADK